MDTIQIKSGMFSDLKFQVEVDGTSSPISEARLSIVLEDIKISYKGSIKEDVASFKIKDFERFAKAGKDYEFILEVFLGNQYFAPFTGKIELIEPVSVEANMVVTEQVTVKASLGSGLLTRVEERRQDSKRASQPRALFESQPDQHAKSIIESLFVIKE